MIYFDNAATAKAYKEVLDTFVNVEENLLGNANGANIASQRVNEFVNELHNNIYKNLKLNPNEYDIIYTSSGTESNNLAIKGYALSHSGFGKHILVSPLEHSSINATLGYLKDNNYDIEFIPLDSNGHIDLNELDSLIRKDTIMVIVSLVEPETGIVQDYKALSELCKNKKVTLFMDIVQGFSKMNIELNKIDMFSISPHKFGGIIGTGLLVKRKEIIITPLIHGGKSLSIYRSGSIPTSLIATIDKAIEISINNQEEHYQHVKKLHDYLLDNLKEINAVQINSKDNFPYIVNISVKGYRGNELVKYFSDKDISISQKSACSVPNTPSKVIMAVYKDKVRATSSIRISLSYMNTIEEIDIFLNALKELINR